MTLLDFHKQCALVICDILSSTMLLARSIHDAYGLDIPDNDYILRDVFTNTKDELVKRNKELYELGYSDIDFTFVDIDGYIKGYNVYGEVFHERIYNGSYHYYDAKNISTALRYLSGESYGRLSNALGEEVFERNKKHYIALLDGHLVNFTNQLIYKYLSSPEIDKKLVAKYISILIDNIKELEDFRSYSILDIPIAKSLEHLIVSLEQILPTL